MSGRARGEPVRSASEHMPINKERRLYRSGSLSSHISNNLEVFQII